MMMRILTVHNFYQQAGGEDRVFADEAALLESHGHQVERFSVHNDAVASMSKLTVARKTLWNSQSASELANIVRRRRIELVHFHNTFPMLSPSVYGAVRKAGAAVVQTLHNYRLMCPPGTFFRDGKVCEDCLGRLPVPSVIHGCYRGSRLGSATVTAMIGLHRTLGTWKRQVDRYIVLSEFARGRFIRGGLAPRRLAFKPNFLTTDPGIGAGRGGYALFVGRLSPEKGIEKLLLAASKITRQMPLLIAGDGPLTQQVREAARNNTQIRYLGRQDSSQVSQLMADAAALVFPSLWYEGMPRTIIESFAVGTPVVAFDLGIMSSMIAPAVNGFLAPVGDEAEFADATLRAASDPALRAGARDHYQRLYTADTNYARLMEIYGDAMASRHGD